MIIDIILDRREGAINYDPATHLRGTGDGTREYTALFTL